MPLSAKYNKDVSATPKHHRNPQLTPAAHPHPFQNRYSKTAWNSFENRRVVFRSRTSGNTDLPTSTCRPRPGHPSGSPPVTHLQLLQRRPLRRPVAPGPHPGGRRPGRAEALPPGGRRRAWYPSAASWLRQERARESGQSRGSPPRPRGRRTGSAHDPPPPASASPDPASSR